MEQLQCALLGFFGDVITPHGVDTAVPSNPIKHPSEVALVASVMPLARDYESLAAFRERCAGGRVKGYVGGALALGIADVLQLYEADVLAMTDATAALHLRTRYAALLRRLVVLTQQQDGGSCADTLREAHAVCQEPRFDVELRRAIGERVFGAVLRNTAHWVAHGEVLDPIDFFISATDEIGDDGDRVEWVADLSRVPPGWSKTLVGYILAAGKERRVLLSDASSDLLNRRGMTELERMRERNEAARIFSRIGDPALVESGEVVLDELERRVRHAHEHWSGAIWAAVKEQSKLLEHLDAVRDLFLHRRGDVWQTFIEAVGPPVLFAGLVREAPGAANARLADDQRKLSAAFGQAMLATGLADDPRFKTYAMSFRPAPDDSTPNPNDPTTMPGAVLTVDRIGARTLANVRRLSLTCRLSPGMRLIVPAQQQKRYVRLCALHTALRLSLFGLAQVRRFAGDVSRSYKSSPLLRELLHIVGTLHFLLTNVAFCLQVDVQETHYKRLVAALSEAKAVEAARAAHDSFMLEVYGGAFLDEDCQNVARSVDAAMMLALGLYVYVQRDTTRAVIKASAGTSRAADSAVHAQHEVHRVLGYIATHMRRRVVAELAPAISIDTRPAHRALWTRLDFNRWLSETAASEAEERRQRVAAQQQQQQQPPPAQSLPEPPQQQYRQQTTGRRTSSAVGHDESEYRHSSASYRDSASVQQQQHQQLDSRSTQMRRSDASRRPSGPPSIEVTVDRERREDERAARADLGSMTPMIERLPDGSVRVSNRTATPAPADSPLPHQQGGRVATADSSVASRGVSFGNADSRSFPRPVLSASAAAALQSRREARARAQMEHVRASQAGRDDSQAGGRGGYSNDGDDGTGDVEV